MFDMRRVTCRDSANATTRKLVRSTGAHARSCAVRGRSRREAPRTIVGPALIELLLGVHHERASANDGLADRRARDEQEATATRGARDQRIARRRDGELPVEDRGAI